MSSPPGVYIEHGAIRGPDGEVLTDLTLRSPKGCATALLGPVGSGKSTLLRTLSGHRPEAGWEVAGTWSVDSAAASAARIRWVPQRGHRDRQPRQVFSPVVAVEHWSRAFDSQVDLVLLDEPLVGTPAEDEDALVAALLEHSRRGGTALVVTHNLRFARSFADHVWFVGAGRQHYDGPAAPFFERPPSEEASRFVRTGSCTWDSQVELELPNHFYWIVEGKLAGLGRPGLSRDADEDYAAMAGAGITTLVSLTKEPAQALQLRSHGIRGRHFYIPDMGIPSARELAGLCGDLQRRIDGGEVVALHCHAGLGRTGTVIACLLCWLGLPSDEAVTWTRTRGNKLCIQTPGQLRFIEDFGRDHQAAQVSASWLV